MYKKIVSFRSLHLQYTQYCLDNCLISILYHWSLSTEVLLLFHCLLVYKYKKDTEETLGDKLAKLSLHSLKKKGSRIKGRLSNTIGLVVQVRWSWRLDYSYVTTFYTPVWKNRTYYGIASVSVRPSVNNWLKRRFRVFYQCLSFLFRLADAS